MVNSVTLLFLSTLLCFALLPRLGFPIEQVLSESMCPAFSSGDLLVCSTHRTELSTGEIAVFRKGGIRIFHRVIGKTEEGYRTKGDANAEADSFIVRPEEVEGRCITVIRGGKNFLLFIRSPYFFAAALLLFIMQGSCGGRKGRNIDKCRSEEP